MSSVFCYNGLLEGRLDFEVVVIGAGVVGLAVAEASSKAKTNFLVIERHASFGEESSSRSSEVIHAGIYYSKNSLKAELCVKGNEMLYGLARKHSIPFGNCGKLIVATDQSEAKKLPAILKNASEMGAKNLKIVDKKEMETLEPHVEAVSAIYCPTSGIIDSHSLMRWFFLEAKKKGVDFLFGAEVFGIEKKRGGYKIKVREESGQVSEVTTKTIVNSAGLSSGAVAAMAGFDVKRLKYEIYYRKGAYFRVQRKLPKMPKMLIYPVSPEESTVGIHTVPELTGGMRLGPYDAWSEKLDYSVDEKLKPLFFSAAKKFLPILEENDISPDMAGFQAKRYGPNEPSRDFVIKEEGEYGFPGFINLIGIESPGLTASPAIALKVKDLIEKPLMD